MFSFVQQLCELEHVLPSEHLKLTTTASVKLSSLPDLFPSTSPPSQWLSDLVSAGTWVNRGSGLIFSFSLDTEGIPLLPSGRTDAVEALGVILRNAEVFPLLAQAHSSTKGRAVGMEPIWFASSTHLFHDEPHTSWTRVGLPPQLESRRPTRTFRQTWQCMRTDFGDK